MDREAWWPFLKRWSQEWITAHDPSRDAPLEAGVLRDAWLGFAPASDAEIAAAEARLGCSLPPSLREFLLVTNGWRHAGNFLHRLAGTTELAWLRDTDDDHWIQAYSVIGAGELLRRSLRLSLAADASVLFLDPEDVDEHGEWAAYWLASWSGMGPERHGSFSELMRGLYASFHALRRPAGQTRDRWDAKVEQARLAALAGSIDEPLAVLEQAQAFGRDRARLLRFQLLAMLGDWHTLPLSHVVFVNDRAALLRDPLFTQELLPLLFAEDRLAHRHNRFTLEHLLQADPEIARPLIAGYQARRREPGFRLQFGNPEFDAAVHRIVDRLTANPAFQAPDPVQGRRGAVTRVLGFGAANVAQVQQARWRLTDAAWPELRDTIGLWRPVTEDHIAPVVLFADPVLAEMLTRERGREILATPRGRLP
jgi:SMI1 / KNR4 family (SUKH-1)